MPPTESLLIGPPDQGAQPRQEYPQGWDNIGQFLASLDQENILSNNSLMPTANDFPADMDHENILVSCRREESDWIALFNPHIPRILDVDLLHTFHHGGHGHLPYAHPQCLL
jgi:hypothetical protein